MLKLPGAPRGDVAREDFFRIEPVSAFGPCVGVTLEHDKRAGASRMCRREHGPRGERAVDRQDDRFATF